MDTTTTTKEHTMDTISNTSAVARIDSDDLATIHASSMADCLGDYRRSVALVVNRSDLYWLRDALGAVTGVDAGAAAPIVVAINETLDLGLR